MMLPSEIVNLHFASSKTSRLRIPPLLAEDCDVSVAESITLERLKDVVCKQKINWHTLNDIKIRFQKSDDELRTVF